MLRLAAHGLIPALPQCVVSQGHEDVDQYFSQIASYLTPQEFSTPQDVVELLDSATRPDREADSFRKQAQRTKVHTHTYKLDEVACWQDWVAALGIRLLGLRTSGTPCWKAFLFSLVQFPTFLLWFCRKVCQEAWGFLSAKIADLCAPSKSIRLSVGFGL